MKVVALVSQLRNSVLEWPSDGAAILYFGQRSETDLELLKSKAGVSKVGLRVLYRVARAPEVMVVEVAEPMWIREWPRHFAAILFMRVVRWVWGLRSPIYVAYAIENLHWRERFSIPVASEIPLLGSALKRFARWFLDRSGAMALDALVFGTPGSRENYIESMPRCSKALETRMLLDQLSQCGCLKLCDDRSPRSLVVQYLGENTPRKGIDILLKAWRVLREERPEVRDWRLRLSGPGCEAIEDFESVECEGRLSREAVYGRLSEADVVVLPSRRAKRWREQKGLPVIEGVRHGCAVVASTETGLAELLEQRAGCWIVEPENANALAEAIWRAGREPRDVRRSVPYNHIESTRVRLWELAASLK